MPKQEQSSSEKRRRGRPPGAKDKTRDTQALIAEREIRFLELVDKAIRSPLERKGSGVLVKLVVFCEDRVYSSHPGVALVSLK